jgi:hypothetical protein
MAIESLEGRLASLSDALRRVLRSDRVVALLRWLGRVAALGGMALAFALFSWIGLVSGLVILVWRRLAWPHAPVAFAAVLLLPVIGLLAGVYQVVWADKLATVAFFALVSAATIGIGRRKVNQSTSFQVEAKPIENGSQPIAAKLGSWLRYHFDYLVSAIGAGIAAQSWFVTDKYIAFGDIFPYLVPSNFLEKALPVWSSFTNGLGARGSAIVNAPVALAARVAESVGVSGPLFERLLLTALFIGEGIAIIYLIRVVWPSARLIARLAGGLFYLFNVLGFFNLPGSVQMLSFLALPLLSALMLQALETGRKRFVYGWALATTMLGYVAANLPLAAVTLLGGSAVALLIHVARGANGKRILGFSCRAIPLAVLLNLWWLVPAAITVLGTDLSDVPTSPEDWGWTHVRNSISNLFTLNAAWGWPQEIYYPYAPSYLNSIASVVIYAPGALAFGSLACSPRRSRLVPALCLLALTLVFVSKGIHAPFESVSQSLLEDVPGLWVLREPASKLLPIVTMIFSILIVHAVDRAAATMTTGRYFARWKWVDPAAGVVLVGLALPIVAWPILNGEIVSDTRPVLPGTHISVPHYWKEAATYLNNSEEGGAVLLLPLSDFYQMPYQWGFYGTDGLAPQLFERPVIVGASIGYIPPSEDVQVAVRRLEESIERGNVGAVRWLTRALGVKYVLLRGDLDKNLARKLGRRLEDSARYQTWLTSSNLIETRASFDPLILYEVKSPDIGPVAAWTRLHIDPTGAASASSGAHDPPTATVASESELGDETNALSSSQVPLVEVVSSDATTYEVDVRAPQAPYILTLNQTYDAAWRLASNDLEGETSEPVRINGYANGWLISEPGTYRLTLEFSPERVARWARWTSLVTMLVIVILWLRNMTSNRTAARVKSDRR